MPHATPWMPLYCADLVLAKKKKKKKKSQGFSVCGRMLVVFLLGFGRPQYLCDLQIYSVHAG